MRGCTLLLGAMAVALAASQAFGDTVAPGQEGELALILTPEPGTRACFSRSYDAAHLAAHPRQTVARMEFRLAYHRFEPDDTYPAGQRNYYFMLKVKRRGESGNASAVGECSSHEGRLTCGVDCDGSGFTLKRAKAGTSLLIDFNSSWGIRLSGGCGGGEAGDADLRPGADDRIFRVDPASGACPAYEAW